MADLTQENRQIELITPLEKDVLLLTGATITESLSGLFAMDLELLSESVVLDFETILGKQVAVRLNLPGDTERFFNGFIGHFKAGGIRDGLLSYTARVYPWLWFLTHTRDCRIFQQRTVPEIIEIVFKSLGFNDYQLRLNGTYKQWEYCVQYRESDFNFVSRLMEHEGIFYYFTHEKDRHIMVLGDSNSIIEPFSGFETIPFKHNNTASGDSISVESIRTFEIEKQIHPGAYYQRDFDFKVPGKNLTTTDSIPNGHDHGEYEIYEYPGHYTETDHGNAYTKMRMEAIRTGYETISCESDARGIATGFSFELTDHPNDSYNKKYLVISAQYHLSTVGSFQSGVAMGEGVGYQVYFNAIDYETPYRPLVKTHKPTVEGPQTAIVSGPKGDEIHTDEYGRVKVQFHWDREGQRDENSSCWIRVSQLWAGKKWGAMYIPRIGQEVIVEFLEGDPDQPIITGRVYNGKSMPPYTLPDEKTKSTIKSYSSKGGDGFNEIRFEDKKGKEQVFFHAERNMDVHVKNNSFESIYGNRHQTIGHEDEGDQRELVHGDKHFRVIGDRVGQIESNDNLTVDSNRMHQVKGNDNLTVDQDLLVKTGKDCHLDVGFNYLQSVGMNYALKSAMNASIKGTQVKLEANAMLEIKCGGSSILLNPAGIFINGAMVYINSGSGGAVSTDSPSKSSPDLPNMPEEPEPADNAKPGEAYADDTIPPVDLDTETPAAAVLNQAAKDGTPFCEECEKARIKDRKKTEKRPR